MPSRMGSVPAPSPHTDVLVTLSRRVETLLSEKERECVTGQSAPAPAGRL